MKNKNLVKIADLSLNSILQLSESQQMVGITVFNLGLDLLPVNDFLPLHLRFDSILVIKILLKFILSTSFYFCIKLKECLKIALALAVAMTCERSVNML